MIELLEHLYLTNEISKEVRDLIVDKYYNK